MAALQGSLEVIPALDLGQVKAVGAVPDMQQKSQDAAQRL